MTDRFLRVPCNRDLLYLTKGKRGKELPLIEPIRRILLPDGDPTRTGLLYRRRAVEEGRMQPPMWSASLESVIAEFQRRCSEAGAPSVPQRLSMCDQVMKDAGALGYKNVQVEFAKLARRLKWSREATLKDFRHAFATAMMNAGMPEPYRQFLMGHAQGKAAIVNYSHLNQIRAQYEAAVRCEWQELIGALAGRAGELGLLRGETAGDGRVSDRRLRLVK